LIVFSLLAGATFVPFFFSPCSPFFLKKNTVESASVIGLCGPFLTRSIVLFSPPPLVAQLALRDLKKLGARSYSKRLLPPPAFPFSPCSQITQFSRSSSSLKCQRRLFWRVFVNFLDPQCFVFVAWVHPLFLLTIFVPTSSL